MWFERRTALVGQALKQAIWVSLGVTIGGVLLPRLLNNQLYNDSYPPLALHMLLYLIAGYAICFITTWLILFLRSKR